MPKNVKNRRGAKVGKAEFGPPHPWRLCPIGEHWVESHDRSNTYHGVRGYCRGNRSGKDQIYSDELERIAEKHFGKLKGGPCSYKLGFSQGDKFDHFIRGWTKYWNEVLRPDDPLDPNLVKALIASESGFRTTAKVRAGKRAGWARGLMQVTDWTQDILADENGELKNHLVNVSQEKLTQANFNIAAGIRWLFRKKETAAANLKRPSTWEDAVADYKSYLSEIKKGKLPTGMKDFLDYYNRLKEKC